VRFLIQGIKLGAIIVLTALVLVGARTAYHSAKESAAKPTGEIVQVQVTKDESVATIGKDLKAKGLISNVNFFRVYVFANQKAKYFAEGSYTLQKGMSMGQIVDVLAGDQIPVVATAITPAPEVTVRIPESVRMEQIPNVLKDSGLTQAAPDFLTVAKTGTFNYDFLKDRPQGASLEGYLFPDTYRFAPDADAKTVITKMLDNFQSKLQEAVNAQSADQRGKLPQGAASPYQVLIIASIIEREAGSDADRADIASVYYNRLTAKPPLPLQADPTVQYAIGTPDQWWKKDLTQDDLGAASPYNTYPNPQNKTGALPPGPICTPSLKSLIAALNPNKTDYLFFVAKNDGSGTHAFAKTNDEQEANKRKYQKP
jgi:UPF0755 protein